MVAVQRRANPFRGPALGLVGGACLLAALDVTLGLTAVGWVSGLLCAAGTSTLLARGLIASGAPGLGPADRVTLTRAMVVAAVAALAAQALLSTPGRGGRGVLVALAAVALALDAVDGWVARRTGTASPLGARFDMEVDAFLILVLSVHVAPAAGAWVLLIGAARYLLAGAEQVLPWLRAPVPRRFWRKVVAAVQGIVLTTVAAALLPPVVSRIGLGVALVLLAESFGRDVWFLHAQRLPERAQPPFTRGGGGVLRIRSHQ
ncbi:MAG: hypothetical protein QOK15_593 [Nocardioidaceae bacterium]|nr:hypothetical protein [Nocardioidaceae bacterium]